MESEDTNFMAWYIIIAIWLFILFVYICMNYQRMEIYRVLYRMEQRENTQEQ
jgi:hypothetical protein